MELNKSKKMRIYAAGGAGTNLGAAVEQYARHTEPGFAAIEISYIDTSRANISEAIPNEAIYLFKGLDGSGGVRGENYPEIRASAKDILIKHEPMDVNVVISSLGGGSGSVIGPVLTNALLADGVPTVVIAIGSKQTLQDAINTKKSLESYEGIAKSNDTPIAMVYLENGEDGPRGSVDRRVVDMVTALASLFSGENAEMDSMDLKKWLKFNEVTSYPVGVANLFLLEKGIDYNAKMGDVIAAASLCLVGGDETIQGLKTVPECQYTGFLPTTIVDIVKEASPIHFLLTHGPLIEKARELESFISQNDKVRDARLNKGSIMGKSARGDDMGMVI